MNKQTQLEYIKKLLLNYGEVSRNHLLQQFITRGGARINDLKNAGWEIDGEYRKTEHGKDFIYVLRKAPYEKVLYRTPDGKEIIRFDKVKLV